ncbi:hypothetical protein VN97_g2680 [Penicillium thymicola]|uniref:Uncharacterized protein n=1 Tax=Penicillium thymicola TaxID=293382 RepID=A0AAI9TNU0_PENTH|nr:hypothetical protein VN97_g2680 [Penicillium thymicola]
MYDHNVLTGIVLENIYSMFMAKGVTFVIIEFERYSSTQHLKGNNYTFDICNQSNQLAKDAIKVFFLEPFSPNHPPISVGVKRCKYI